MKRRCITCGSQNRLFQKQFSSTGSLKSMVCYQIAKFRTFYAQATINKVLLQLMNFQSIFASFWDTTGFLESCTPAKSWPEEDSRSPKVLELFQVLLSVYRFQVVQWNSIQIYSQGTFSLHAFSELNASLLHSISIPKCLRKTTDNLWHGPPYKLPAHFVPADEEPQRRHVRLLRPVVQDGEKWRPRIFTDIGVKIVAERGVCTRILLEIQLLFTKRRL